MLLAAKKSDHPLGSGLKGKRCKDGNLESNESNFWRNQVLLKTDEFARDAIDYFQMVSLLMLSNESERFNHKSPVNFIA